MKLTTFETQITEKEDTKIEKLERLVSYYRLQAENYKNRYEDQLSFNDWKIKELRKQARTIKQLKGEN